MSKNNYKGKKIWITGASSGIGEALTYEFSKLDAEIIISSRRQDELERVKQNCKNPENISIQLIDLSKHDEISKIADKVISEHGFVDILVNNGGISQRSLTVETAIEVDKKIMNINYFGTIILTKAVLPQMMKRKTGHVVTISSLTGKFGAPSRSAYSASKHALHGFFDTVRSEMHKYNVYVSVICPGYTRTNVSINALTANGETNNYTDKDIAGGMKPEVLAAKIIKAVDKKKAELIVGGNEVIAVYLKRFCPRLLYRLLRKKAYAD